MNLLSILKALGIKISPQIEEAIAKAQQLANNYGNSKEGFIKAVNENGGTESLTKALATLDNPNVARVLTALGHPPESIKQAVNSLGAITPTPQQTPNNQNISKMLGFGVGYLALTESGRKQLIKVSNQGGELVNKLTDKYIGEPISKALGGIESVTHEEVVNASDEEAKLD